ncbi:hypothetical protein A2335_01540 [Candidatus Peregrinibacteria bacterium RIFOXYB2_FULL_32_7]|nr:MAG: hypothetical protein A2335_01540 [Candidatus Peregrinibacteria bacterium RIFOXYB2_FULL_32_7]
MSYHHFKGANLSRSELIQKLVIERILNSKIKDKDRENSKIWELKHDNTCIQISKILALKRDLNLEFTEIIAALHDIYAIDTGKYTNHAKLGAEIAKKILKSTKKFTNKEIDLICQAIAHHSEKQIYTNNPYIELIKDADIYDCSLYEGTAQYYKENKDPKIYKEYFKRVKKISKELGVKIYPKFKI